MANNNKYKKYPPGEKLHSYMVDEYPPGYRFYPKTQETIEEIKQISEAQLVLRRAHRKFHCEIGCTMRQLRGISIIF